MATDAPALGTWVRSRLGLVGSGAVVGVFVGIVAVAALALYGGARFGIRKAFALGALAVGLGALGWSGYGLVGRRESRPGVPGGVREQAGASGRRAMARVTGFGIGIMLGVTLIEALL